MTAPGICVVLPRVTPARSDWHLQRRQADGDRSCTRLLLLQRARLLRLPPRGPRGFSSGAPLPLARLPIP
eukprot:11816890-Alexandrium_andersonii.AAC.1